MTDADLDHRVRDHFARVPPPSHVDPSVAFDAVVSRLRRRRRRRVTARIGLALLIVAGIAGAIAATHHNKRQDIVTKPAPRAEPPVVLLTVGWQEGPRLADPATGVASSIGPPMDSSWQWCNTCLIVRAGGKAFTAQNGRLFSFTPGDGSLRDIGRADLVFPATTNDAIFVSVAGQLEERSLDGAPIAGPWTIPDGYSLSEQPHAVTGGFIVTNKSSFIGDLAWWDLASGGVHPLGEYNQFIDVHPSGGGPSDTLAWTVCPTGDFPCSLVMGSLDGSSRRTIEPPVAGNGFYLGGAFSPDGSMLATTLSMHPGTVNPDAALALVDVATGRTTVVPGSTFGVGEPYGYVAWSPDGDTIFFTGDRGVRSFAVRSGRISDLGLPGTYYSVVALSGLDRRGQCPDTEYRPRGQPATADGADGLPQSGAATAAKAEASLEAAREQYGAESASVWAEPGRAWTRAADGSISIVSETLYTDVLELPSADKCPEHPAFYNGVPLTFVVREG